MTRTFKLEELAAAAGVSPRTVRYYVQRGLLPAPDFRGKDTAYSEAHLLRLQAIKRLQAAHLPLDEIQVRLANLPDSELARVGTRDDGKAMRSAPAAPPLGNARAGGPVAVAEVYRLAPGVELWVRGDLPETSRPLVRDILHRYPTPETKDHGR